jgi:cbb3-type cytochrome oxidase subunit 3
MSQMTKDILVHFPWPWLTSIALVMFLCLFVGLVVRLSMKSRSELFASAQNLPLQDGEKL